MLFDRLLIAEIICADEQTQTLRGEFLTSVLRALLQNSFFSFDQSPPQALLCCDEVFQWHSQGYLRELGAANIIRPAQSRGHCRNWGTCGQVLRGEESAMIQQIVMPDRLVA